ncbi:MAG TPA: 30S ribosome-binding factor RbfA [Acidobacteria bacterium]|nr:30S ribosome-binding factor RbfA [Acidobacteriota bacterium]
MAHQSFDRNARLQESIRTVLAELLVFSVKDPRLDGVTVSGVRLSADRSIATIYFSIYGDDERERQAADGFTAAGPFLRRELARRMRLRIIPELRFRRDTSYAYGEHMEKVFEKLHEEGLLPPEGSGGPTEEE